MSFDPPISSLRDESGSLRTSRSLQVRRLGLVPYADGLELQRQLVEDA